MEIFDVDSFNIGSLFIFCLCLWGCYKIGLIQSFVSLIIWFLAIFVWMRLAIYFFPEFKVFFEILGILDIVILIFVGAGIWRGFEVGLIQSLVSFVGWLFAVLFGSRLAIYIGPPISTYLESTIFVESSILQENPVLQMALGFLIIILFIFALIQVTIHLLNKVAKALKLKLLDQFSGGALGGMRNILILLAVLNLIAPLIVTLSLWQNSIIAPKLMPYAPLAQRTIKDTFGVAWEQFNNSIDFQDIDIFKSDDDVPKR